MKKSLFIVAAIIFTTFNIGSISADPVSATVSVNSATLFDNVYNDGTNVGYIFAVRYNLPQIEWYQYLNDQTGCLDNTPSSTIKCSKPSTLSSTLVTIGLYKSNGDSYGSAFTEPLLVIGNTLTGINVFDLPTVDDVVLTPSEISNDGSKVCVQVLDNDNVPPTIQDFDCSDIVLSSSIFTDNKDTKEKEFDTVEERLITYLSDEILSIQTDNMLPEESLITNTQKVIGDGVFITRRVSPLLQQVIPELFSVGLVSVFGTPVAGATPITQGLLQLEATPTTVYSSADTVAKQYFGISGSVLLTFGFLILALGSSLGMYLLSGNATIGTGFGFVSVLVMTTFLVPQFLVNILSAGIILVVMTALWLSRKSPN